MTRSMKFYKNQFIRITAICFGILIIGLLSMRCSSNDQYEEQESHSPKKQRPVALQNGKFFEVEGVPLLYGGEDSSQHFVITDLELVKEQFHYGIGREKFPALLDPIFVTVEQADELWDDSTRFLLVYSEDDVKAYSIKDLTRHEVVNDVFNGKPIMAAYCVLADLGAIYDRNYGGNDLTFALSGYTYYDEDVWDGVDGFVFWDRETESLWWPLIGKAVSGPLKGVELQVMDEMYWKEVKWKEIKSSYQHAQVLKSGQDYERPKEWDKLNDVSDIVENYSENQ